MLYANYIRNKMRHLLKTVFASGYPLKVISRFRKKAAGYTIHGKTETGKNLISFPYAFFGGNTTKTVNGITFTDNGDGTITLNGTSTLNKYFSLMLNSDVYGSIDKTKTYTISMQGGEIGKTDIMLALRLNNKFVANVCTLSKPTIDFASYSTEFDGAYITLTVEANASFDNVVVKPQFEIGDTATEYEPYTKYGVGDKTKNLFDEETILPQHGFVKQDDGSYYVAKANVPRGNVLYENTDGYTGQFYISYKTKYLTPENSGVGVYMQVWYTDETWSVVPVALKTNWFDSSLFINANKTVSKIIWTYGNTVQSTWVKDILIVKLDDEANNLIPYPYSNTTKTVNGITFTDNKDGSVTVNGTATDNVTFYIKTVDKNFKPSSPILCISGCPAGGSSTTYRMTVNAFKQTETGYTYVAGVSDIGNGVVLNLTNKDYSQLEIAINVLSGTTVNNLVFKPKLISLDYEPYGYKIPLVNVGKNLLNIADITITQTNSYYASRRYTDIHKYFPELEYCKGLPVIFKAVCSHSAFEPEIVIAFSDNSTLTNRGNKSSIISKDKTVTWIEIRGRSDSADYNGTSVTLTNIQLELGSSATEYEPYRAPDTTNVYNNAQLKDGESINYKADDLPELQLYKGENNITADTAVTPSAIDIKYLN